MLDRFVAMPFFITLSSRYESAGESVISGHREMWLPLTEAGYTELHYDPANKSDSRFFDPQSTLYDDRAAESHDLATRQHVRHRLQLFHRPYTRKASTLNRKLRRKLKS